MSHYAEIIDGAISNIIVAEADEIKILQGEWVQVDVLTPHPGIGWEYNSGVFTPPIVSLTLAQQAAVLLSSGFHVTCAAMPTMNGTYSVDLVAQQHIASEIVSILLNNTFADGLDIIDWQDVVNSSHTMTIAEFKLFATAHAAFVSNCLKVINGQSITLPTQPTQI